jgi:hypothetical protein
MVTMKLVTTKVSAPCQLKSWRIFIVARVAPNPIYFMYPSSIPVCSLLVHTPVRAHWQGIPGDFDFGGREDSLLGGGGHV